MNRITVDPKQMIGVPPPVSIDVDSSQPGGDPDDSPTEGLPLAAS